MARSATRAEGKSQSRLRLAIILIGGSLLLGLAAGTLSYLDSSLVIGPAWRASTEELRERGARIYFESCAGFAEPRFWPECVGDAEEKRLRGASQLVLVCNGTVPYKRFFDAEDCLAEDRPPFALIAGPRQEDAVAGGLVAAVAFVVLTLTSTLFVSRQER